ncbi:MAG: hypothetical protein B0D92_04490 [Spirochaeta sp. LUC14_002_19_P3]|nr:MAG: hypothetical protein B0D92_04490 [Spirochaeta sp. LUC14_002_19_P3]
MKRSIFFVLLTFIVLGCSEAPPTIDQVDWRIVYRDNGFRYEELMLFMRVSDPDDDEDPNEVTVIAQDTGFLWKFERNEWTQIDRDGTTWWGMPGMIPYSGSTLPNALYKVILKDLAGQTVETSFRLNSSRPQIFSIKWPTVNIENNRLSYSGSYSNPLLILRAENHSMLSKTRANNGYVIQNADAVWWEIWISLTDSGNGIRLGPYRLAGK